MSERSAALRAAVKRTAQAVSIGVSESAGVGVEVPVASTSSTFVTSTFTTGPRLVEYRLETITLRNRASINPAVVVRPWTVQR